MDVLNALVTVSEKIKRYIAEQLRVVDKKFEDQQTAIAANTDTISKKSDISWVTEQIQTIAEQLTDQIETKPSPDWVNEQILAASNQLNTQIESKADKHWVEEQIGNIDTTGEVTEDWVTGQIQAAIDSTWEASY